MAAVTTVPRLDSWACPPRPGESPRVATPRGRRTSRATFVRRRVVIATLALAGVAVVAGQAGAALGSSPLTAPGRRPTVSGVRTIVVRPGDTLWGVAQRLAPGQDPRPVVDQLAAVYGNQPLQPGEAIRWSG